MTDQRAATLPDWIADGTDGEPYEWVTSAWERAASIPGAWFDHAKAEGVVKRWPEIFRLTNDRFKGIPFLLLPWQKIVVRLLVGWKKPIEVLDPATHRMVVAHVRVFRRLDLWIPRKNGKSEFLAALAALFFVLEKVPGAEGYVFARNEEQGFVPFNKLQAILNEAVGLVEDRNGNQRILMTKKSIEVKETNAVCVLLTGKPDGKHGRAPTMILGDEIHEWTTRELANNLRQGTGSRLQPIQLYASTAGRKANRVGFDWYEESLAIMAGEIDDQSTLVVHFAIGDEDDWTDERVWRRANPSLGLTPTLDYLRGEFKAAKGRPVQEALFQCYHLNRWVDQVGGWLPKSIWAACAPDKDAWKSAYQAMRGRKGYGACDVSAARDLTALVWLFPPDEAHPRWVVLPMFWVPEETLAERAAEDRRVDWKKWVDAGALRTTPGNSVDQDFVAEAIKAGIADFEIEGLGFDPWNARKLMTDLEKDGVPIELMVEMRQGTATLGEPTKLFERLVFAASLDHGGHPVLAWMAGHCRVRFDENLNYVPAKKASLDKIDGIVATVMCLALAVNEEGDKVDIDDFLSNAVIFA